MMIINADDGTGKGQDFAKGGEDRGVDDACGRYDEGGDEEMYAEEH